MLPRLWLLVGSKGPTDRQTMSLIELSWTAKNTLYEIALTITVRSIYGLTYVSHSLHCMVEVPTRQIFAQIVWVKSESTRLCLSKIWVPIWLITHICCIYLQLKPFKWHTHCEIRVFGGFSLLYKLKNSRLSEFIWVRWRLWPLVVLNIADPKNVPPV